MLNVFDFASRLDPLLNAFDGATTGLEEMYQAAAEASYLSKQR
jgi:hypothetical protein